MKVKVLLWILASLFIMMSCEDEEVKADYCYLISLIEDGDLQEFFYNADQKMERINTSGSVYILMKYFNSKIIKLEYYDGTSLISYHEISWNGDVVNTVKLYELNENNIMELVSTLNYTYTSGKLSKITTTTYNVTLVTNYTWVNNNVVVVEGEYNGYFAYKITYEYDNKKNPYAGFSEYMYIYAPEGISENNVTLATELNESNIASRIITYTYTYNHSDYPLSATIVNEEIGEQTETSERTFDYECVVMKE